MSLVRLIQARSLYWRTHLAFRDLARLDALRDRRSTEAAALLAQTEANLIAAQRH